MIFGSVSGLYSGGTSVSVERNNLALLTNTTFDEQIYKHLDQLPGSIKTTAAMTMAAQAKVK